MKFDYRLLKNSSYISKPYSCSGVCMKCKHYRKGTCKGYIKTFIGKDGRIITQVLAPLEIDYIN